MAASLQNRLMGHGSVRFGVAVLAFMVTVAMLAPWLGTVDPAAMDANHINKAAGLAGDFALPDGQVLAHTFWLGTDNFGRDIYSRVLYGSRISLVVGIATAILSNGSKDMLTTVVESNGLKPYLDKVVTVEEVRLFKTSPQAYELLLKAFPVKKEEILFVSSNAWDALAARWYGFDVFWVNRLGHPFEEIGEKPNYEGTSLTKVLDVI